MKGYSYSLFLIKSENLITLLQTSEAGFIEFKFEPGLNYGWFHLQLYSIFQDLSRRWIETGFWGIWDEAQIH